MEGHSAKAGLKEETTHAHGIPSMKTAGSDADVILLIFDPLDIHFTDEVIELLRSINKPILLAVNKIDTSENRKPM
jgi:predicted GTPase